MGWVCSSGLFFEAAGLNPAGWLILVWILSISHATAARFGLAIAAGPLMVSRESIRGAVEASEWAAAMWPRWRVETLLPKDGPSGGCRCVTPSGCGIWSVPRPVVLIASMTGWLPDRVGDLHKSGMTGDSPGSRRSTY